MSKPAHLKISAHFLLLIACAMPFSSHAGNLVVPFYPGTVVIDSDEQVETEKRLHRRPKKDTEERLKNGIEATEQRDPFRPSSIVIDSAAQEDVERRAKMRDNSAKEKLIDDNAAQPAPIEQPEKQVNPEQRPEQEGAGLRPEENNVAKPVPAEFPENQTTREQQPDPKGTSLPPEETEKSITKGTTDVAPATVTPGEPGDGQKPTVSLPEPIVN